MPYSIGNVSLCFLIIAALALSIVGITGPQFKGQTLDPTLKVLAFGYIYLHKIVRVVDGVSSEQPYRKNEFVCPVYFNYFTAALVIGIIGCMLLGIALVVLGLRAFRWKRVPKLIITLLSCLSFLLLLTSFSISLSVYSVGQCDRPSYYERYFYWDWGLILSMAGCALVLVVVAGSLIGRK